MKLIIIFSLIVLTQTSCIKAQSDLTFPPLHFNVDTELVSNQQYQISKFLTFLPPAKYSIIPDSVVTMASANILGKHEGKLPRFTPIMAFVSNQLPQAILIISNISHYDTTNKNFTKFVQYYDSLYANYKPNAETTIFSINEVCCWQARIFDIKQIQYRLLIDDRNQPPIQLDFVYNTAPTADMGRVLESILGSIRYTN